MEFRGEAARSHLLQLWKGCGAAPGGGDSPRQVVAGQVENHERPEGTLHAPDGRQGARQRLAGEAKAFKRPATAGGCHASQA